MIAKLVNPEAESDSLELPGEDESETIELLVAPLGASTDGTPVPEHFPLGFLSE